MEESGALPAHVFIAAISSVGVFVASLAGIMICIFICMCYRELHKRRETTRKRDSDRVGLLRNKIDDDITSDQFEDDGAKATNGNRPVESSALPADNLTAGGSNPVVTTLTNGTKASHSPAPSSSSTSSSGKKGKTSVKDDLEELVCSKIDSSDNESERNVAVDQCNAGVDPSGDMDKLIEIKKREVPPKKICESLPVGSEAIAKLTQKSFVQNDFSSNPFNKEYTSVPSNAVTSLDQTAAEKAKNRYRNVLPNPHSAVHLKDLGVDGSTYINANFVEGLHGEGKAYIAAQGPIHETMSDFWRMVWEEDVPVIVMLTNLIEKGRHKCVKYWPDSEEDKPTVYGNIEVTNIAEEKIPSCYTLSHLKVKNLEDEEERDVYHFWYVAWPDFGIPKNSQPIFTLRTAVDNYRTSNIGPIVVHCSAGLGRSGTFIAIDMGVEQFGEDGVVDPLKYLCSMRENRGGMIQTVDQYWFVYKALSDYMN